MVRIGHIPEASQATIVATVVVAAMFFSIAGQVSSYDETYAVLASEPMCMLHGWVNDSATLEGIEGAMVIAVTYEPFSNNLTETNETGYYEIEISRGLTLVGSQATGYLIYTMEIDTSGMSEYRLDIAMESEPTIPEVHLTLDPTSNVSRHNPLEAHMIVDDFNLDMIEILIGEVYDRNGDWVNFTAAATGLASPSFDFVVGDLEFTYSDDVFDGYFAWSATRNDAGYLKSGSTSEYVTMSASKTINYDESLGLAGYYSNDTVELEEGVAWFNNETGEYEGFEFFNLTAFDSVDGIPDAPPNDLAGVITPLISLTQIKMNVTSLDELYETVESNRVPLDPRSVIGLTFEYEGTARSGEYIAFMLAMDEAVNINWTECLFTVDTDPPVANAGEDQTVSIGEQLSLNGSASVDNVGIVNYTWTIVVDQYDSTVERYGVMVDYVFEGAGDLQATLTVTDGGGNTATDTIALTVEQDAPPVAEAGPSIMTVEEDVLVTFNGTASTDDVSIAGYAWEIIELEEFSSDAVFEFIFETPGIYHVELVVEDSIGQTSEPDAIVVTVTDETAPMADAGDDITVSVGATVTLDASASIDNVDIVTYIWSCDELEDWESSEAIVEVVIGSSNIPIYNFTLEVFDAAGNSDSDMVKVTVVSYNAVPIADAGDDQEVDVGDPVTFDASGSISDGEIVNYTWIFEYDGDTMKLYGEVVEFTFEIDGSYDVNLTITDDQGLKDYDEMTVKVRGESTSAAYVPYVIAALAALVLVVVAAILLMKKRGPSA